MPNGQRVFSIEAYAEIDGIRQSGFFNLSQANNTIITFYEQLHTVTFDSAGGTQVDSVSLRHGDLAEEPADPALEGYEFKGWMLDGAAYDFDTPVTADITLTASWEAIALPGTPITSLRIAGADGQQVAGTVTVSRGSSVQFGAIVNDGASTENIVWTISNTALAAVDANGAVSIRNSVGMVTLTARDAETGISHSITLRIA